MRPFIFLILTALITSCAQKPSLAYKFSDKEQSISCVDQNNKLLNEALHSFEEDIRNHNFTVSKTLNTAYAQFIFKGILGTAPYKSIVSEHSLKIRDELMKEGIILENGVKSNLNYEHPAVKCIINNIEDKDLKKTINGLLSSNSMDIKLFNSRLRNFGRQGQQNRNQAMYLALESYYQYIVGLSLDEEKPND
jgi:CRISPR/Cas system-associated protein Csx1